MQEGVSAKDLVETGTIRSPNPSGIMIRSEGGFNPYNYEGSGNERGSSTQHTNLPCAKPLNTFEIFFTFFSTFTSSVWINSTVKATGKHLQFG